MLKINRIGLSISFLMKELYSDLLTSCQITLRVLLFNTLSLTWNCLVLQFWCVLFWLFLLFTRQFSCYLFFLFCIFGCRFVQYCYWSSEVRVVLVKTVCIVCAVCTVYFKVLLFDISVCYRELIVNIYDLKLNLAWSKIVPLHMQLINSPNTNYTCTSQFCNREIACKTAGGRQVTELHFMLLHVNVIYLLCCVKC